MKTFKSFMEECELYPHSQERYDLMKECAEVAVMAQFLENQHFYEENKAMLESVAGVHGEQYLMESVAESQIQVLEERFTEKVKNLGGKIGSGFKKLWEAVKTLLVKLVNKFDDSCSLASKLKKSLQEVKTSEGWKAVLDAIGAAGPDRLKIHPNQLKLVSLKKMDVNSMTGLDANDNAMLAALLSTSYVVIDTNGSGFENAIPADAIIKIAKRISSGSSKIDYDSILKEIDSLKKDTRDNGLKINVNKGSMDKLINELGGIDATIGANSTTSGTSEGATSTDAAEAIAKLNEIYSVMTGVVGDVIKAYNACRAFRLNCLDAAIKAASNATATGSKESGSGSKEGNNSGTDSSSGDPSGNDNM